MPSEIRPMAKARGHAAGKVTEGPHGIPSTSRIYNNVFKKTHQFIRKTWRIPQTRERRQLQIPLD
jgi:hypothetical protein